LVSKFFHTASHSHPAWMYTTVHPTPLHHTDGESFKQYIEPQIRTQRHSRTWVIQGQSRHHVLIPSIVLYTTQLLERYCTHLHTLILTTIPQSTLLALLPLTRVSSLRSLQLEVNISKEEVDHSSIIHWEGLVPYAHILTHLMVTGGGFTPTPTTLRVQDRALMEQFTVLEHLTFMCVYYPSSPCPVLASIRLLPALLTCLIYGDQSVDDFACIPSIHEITSPQFSWLMKTCQPLDDEQQQRMIEKFQWTRITKVTCFQHHGDGKNIHVPRYGVIVTHRVFVCVCVCADVLCQMSVVYLLPLVTCPLLVRYSLSQFITISDQQRMKYWQHYYVYHR
jgi:hypothetical protein